MKARLVPDGYDPTQEEFPLRGPTLRGCLLKMGCLGSLAVIGIGIVIVALVSASKTEVAAEPTIPAAISIPPTWTPEASPTPITIYFSSSPYPTYTPYPTPDTVEAALAEIELLIATATLPPAPAQMVIEVVTSSLKVRAAPSAQSEQLGLLSKGGRIVVDTVSFDGYWLGFSYWGRRAWVGSDASLVKIIEGERRGLPVTGVTYEVAPISVSQTTPTAAPTAVIP